IMYVVGEQLDGARHARRQRGGEIAIDLDGGDVGGARGEARRQDAGPGADLDEAVVAGRGGRVDHLVGPRPREKGLAETLPGSVTHAFSIDSPRQNFSSISSISSSLIPK